MDMHFSKKIIPNLIDPIDREIIILTQAGLPLVARPYAAIGKQLRISSEEVMARIEKMKSLGLIRRIAVVPNHYALGYQANGMSVWDIPDELVDEIGGVMGGLAFVSHCYSRPRLLPKWPYNLFAMVHGKSRDEVNATIEEVAYLIGDLARKYEVIYSTRILKKTGIRISNEKKII